MPNARTLNITVFHEGESMKRLIYLVLLYVVVISAQAQPKLSSAVNRSFRHDHMQIDLEYVDDRAVPFDSELRRYVAQALDTYGALFGGPPRDGSGKPLGRLRFEIKHGPAAFGEADPGLVRLTLNNQKVFGQEAWPLVVLHEMFHLWNAERFRYRTDEEQWFNEGITELYAMRTAVQMGIIPRDQVPVRFAIPLACYVTAKGLGTVSMREAGPKKSVHYFLVYHGGLTAGLVLDREIRRQSAGERSLDDLMRWLYAGFDARDRRYTIEDLATALDQIGVGNYRPFLERYIVGKEVIPLSSFLDFGTLGMETMRGLLLPDKPVVFSDPGLAAAVGLR